VADNFGRSLAYVRAVHFAATIIAAGSVIFEVTVAASAFAAAAGMLDPERRLRGGWSWLVWASPAVAAVSGDHRVMGATNTLARYDAERVEQTFQASDLCK
jgi:hypothetical protein